MEKSCKLLKKGTIDLFMITDIFKMEFLIYALTGALLSSAATSIISVFVSLKKISYMGEAFSHISFAGIAIALLLGLNPTLTNLIFVSAMALLIAILARNYNFEAANVTTIFLSVSMALGIVLLSLNKDNLVDIESYLFGNVLLVNKFDLIQLAALAAINLLYIVLFFKELFYITYNHEISKIYRIPVKPIYISFIILLAVNIIISLKIIGVVLIVSQLILPGVCALNISNNVKKSILLSFIFSEISSLIGFYFSYILDIPSGATIVLTMFCFFVITLIIGKYSKKN